MNTLIVHFGEHLMLPVVSSISLSRIASIISCRRVARVSFKHDNNSESSGKYYIEKENLMAHQVLESRPNYVNTVVASPFSNANTLCEKTTSNSVFRYFTNISIENFEEKIGLEDIKYNDLALELASNFPKANFQDMLSSLCSLCLWPPSPKSYSRNFKMIWNAADEACTKKLDGWSNDQKLLIGDYWFHLKLSRISNYNMHMIENLVHCSESLTSPQIVQLMFYVNLQRSIPQNLLDSLNKPIEAIIKEISVPEICVICLGFFKTETRLINLNTLRIIINRLVEDMDNVNNSTVVGILKCLRKSFQYHITEFYMPLMRRLAVNMHRWDAPTAVHTALLCSSTNIYEPFLLDGVVDKMKESFSDLRLKDIFKLLQCLSTFNYQPSDNFCDTVCKEILKKSRELETWEYSRDTVFISLFLSYFEHYDFDLIQRVFDSDFVNHCSKNFKDIMNVLAMLDYSVRIECKGYKGPRLNVNFLETLTANRGYINENTDVQRSAQFSMIFKLYETLKEIYGEEDVCIRHVLPHFFNQDVIVRLRRPKESQQKILPLSSIVKTYPSDSLFEPPSGDIWLCAIVCGPFSYAFKSDVLCGLMQMKKRQLEKIGFKVVLLSFKEIPTNAKHRKKILEKKFKSIEYDVIGKSQ